MRGSRSGSPRGRLPRALAVVAVQLVQLAPLAEPKLCAGVSDMRSPNPTLDGIWDASPLCAGLEATRPLHPGGNSYAISDGPYTGNGDLGIVIFPEDAGMTTYFAHDLTQLWTPQATNGALQCGYGGGGKRSVGMAKLTRI
eukprot:SAG31_NODE_16746_length_697_cov_2.575251_1_plen_140_part_01